MSCSRPRLVVQPVVVLSDTPAPKIPLALLFAGGGRGGRDGDLANRRPIPGDDAWLAHLAPAMPLPMPEPYTLSRICA